MQESEELKKRLQVQQAIVRNAQRYFLDNDFYPIYTPKIVPFKDDEVEHLIKARVPGKENEELYLSRSPQLYKEIACLSSPNGRVYEIGPVFRGEPFSKGRGANEFLGLDVEIETNDINDVINVLEGYIMNLKDDEDLVAILEQYSPNLTFPQKLVRVPYADAKKLLAVEKIGSAEEQDLSRVVGESEKGAWILLTDFPADFRGFYQTNSDTGLTDSFDLIYDWEICSGGMRRMDVDEYLSLLKKIGWSTKEFKYYADFKKENIQKNTGGFGIGLERLIGALTKTTEINRLQPYPRIPGIKINF